MSETTNIEQAGMVPVLAENENSESMRRGFFKRLLPSRKGKMSAANRRHKRHNSACIGTLFVINSATSLEGIVSEVSQSGLKFRPAKAFILDRKQVQISLEFAGMRVSGKIVATREDGYGIALFEQLKDDAIKEALEKSDKQIMNFIY